MLMFWLGLISGQGGGSTDAILQETGDNLLLEAGTPVVRNSAIPAQAAAGAITGTEWLAIVQGGVTVKVSAADLALFIRTL